MTYDLKIKNGTIVDGTGKPRFRGDVAVKDGLIVDIGVCADGAKETFDAEGAIVTPGFVDVHTHYDGQVSWDSKLAPSSLHGTTTTVMGLCGVGFAPCRISDRDRLIQLMEGVEDIPGTALAEGIRWSWETFPEYMSALDAMPHAIDYSVMLPHDPMRVWVMGDRALASEDATENDLKQMHALMREALAHGASGFSTGRTDNHRAIDGSWTPGADARAEELETIARAFSGFSHGVLHAVSDFDMERNIEHFDREFDVIDRMARAAAGHTVSVSLVQRDLDPVQWQKILRRAEASVAQGFPMQFHVAARGIGVILGFETTFHPFIGFPSYKKISHLPLAERVAIMRDPAFKAQLLSEKSDKVAGDGSPVPPMADRLLEAIDMISMRFFRLGENPNYEPPKEESLFAESMRSGKRPIEVIYDVLLEKDGKEFIYFPVYNYSEFNLDNVFTMMSHPLAVPGLSDGGAHVGTICDASFPTYMLTHWARDRKKDRFTLERVVQMLTGDTAKYIGMASDRGTIAIGKRADLNVIDHDKLRLRKPELVADLPANGKRLLQYADGYRATFVRGEKIIANNQYTGREPGRLVRLGQSQKAALASNKVASTAKASATKTEIAVASVGIESKPAAKRAAVKKAAKKTAKKAAKKTAKKAAKKTVKKAAKKTAKKAAEKTVKKAAKKTVKKAAKKTAKKTPSKVNKKASKKPARKR